ncbi:hypothetical protein [Streptomyces sp. NPDC088748]
MAHTTAYVWDGVRKPGSEQDDLLLVAKTCDVDGRTGGALS